MWDIVGASLITVYMQCRAGAMFEDIIAASYL